MMPSKNQNTTTSSQVESPPAYTIHDFATERASSSQHREGRETLRRSTIKKGFLGILRGCAAAPAGPSSLMSKEDVAAAVATALASHPGPLNRQDLSKAVKTAAETAKLEERVAWLELERNRLQRELQEEKAKNVKKGKSTDNGDKDKAWIRWEDYEAWKEESGRT